MFTDLASIRTDLETRLTPLLPSGWKFEPTIDGTIKASAPVLYIEFTAFEPRVQNNNLARGQVAARFNLIITDPKTDTKKAEDAVDEHVRRLIGAIDSMDDIYWDTAEKKRLPDGPLAWTVNTFAIADTTTEE